ncbi:unnamed protein product, partial [Heterobilharzia americana]
MFRFNVPGKCSSSISLAMVNLLLSLMMPLYYSVLHFIRYRYDSKSMLQFFLVVLTTFIRFSMHLIFSMDSKIT